MANDERVIGRPFQPGQSGNPRGRPRGSRHRLSEDFLAELCEDWAAHGKDALRRACEEDPVGYIRVVASLVPKQIERVENPLSELTDEELEKLHDYLESIASRDEGSESAPH
jgi:hypothetical protein